MKLLHIFYIVVLGVFLIPNTTYSCGNVTSKNSTKTETSSKKTEKSCCKDTSKTTKTKSCCNDQKSNGDDEPCSGKCGHSNCTSAPANGSMTFFNEPQFGLRIFAHSSKEQNFNYTHYNLSSGYVSLWLIPKIS